MSVNRSILCTLAVLSLGLSSVGMSAGAGTLVPAAAAVLLPAALEGSAMLKAFKTPAGKAALETLGLAEFSPQAVAAKVNALAPAQAAAIAKDIEHLRSLQTQASSGVNLGTATEQVFARMSLQIKGPSSSTPTTAQAKAAIARVGELYGRSQQPAAAPAQVPAVTETRPAATTAEKNPTVSGSALVVPDVKVLSSAEIEAQLGQYMHDIRRISTEKGVSEVLTENYLVFIKEYSVQRGEPAMEGSAMECVGDYEKMAVEKLFDAVAIPAGQLPKEPMQIADQWAIRGARVWGETPQQARIRLCTVKNVCAKTLPKGVPICDFTAGAR